MNVETLQALLSHYEIVVDELSTRIPSYNNFDESVRTAKIRNFLQKNPRGLWRDNLLGHTTASALVYNPNSYEVLLMHHKKLNKWLQMGGHSDGEPQLHLTALKEATEETGLDGLQLTNWLPKRSSCTESPLFFDCDVHAIPEIKNVPAHYHYDFRFLVVARGGTDYVVNEEAHALQWFSMDEAKKLTKERSLIRIFDKLTGLKEHGLID